MFPSLRRRTGRDPKRPAAGTHLVPLFSSQYLNAQIASEPADLARIDNSEDGGEQARRNELVFPTQAKSKSKHNPSLKTCLSRHDNQVVIRRRDIN